VHIHTPEPVILLKLLGTADFGEELRCAVVLQSDVSSSALSYLCVS